jgi:hypothetical protein
MDIFKKLKELNLPLGEYVIIGSGILDALNLREAHDLDVVVLPPLFKKLADSGKFKEVPKYETIFLSAEDVEIIPRLGWDGFPADASEAIKTAMMINGFPFLNIEETIRFKTAMGRDNDFHDIELLEKYKLTQK